MRGAGRRLRQRSNDNAVGEVNLECVVRESLGIAQHDVGNADERRLVGFLAPQCGFGGCVTPGLVGDTPKRQAGLFDRLAFQLEPSGDRDQCERIGKAIADLEVGVICREAPRRQLDGVLQHADR